MREPTFVLVTEFVVRHDDGPPVTAKRAGTSWNFAWRGGSGIVATDHKTAEKIATGLAERLHKIEPLEDELKSRYEDMVEWLNDQREPG